MNSQILVYIKFYCDLDEFSSNFQKIRYSAAECWSLMFSDIKLKSPGNEISNVSYHIDM